MKRSVWDWGGNIAAFLVMIAVNVLANALPLGGQTAPEISAKYPTLFTPAGFTFSIWSVIYLSLLGFVIYQALPVQRTSPVIARLDGWFKVNCLLNAAWIFVWHYDMLLLSLVCMFGILTTLLVIYRMLATTRKDVRWEKRILIALPFSLYLSWITVATIANISLVQVGQGWEAWLLSEVTWTWVKLALAGAVCAGVVLWRHDVAFALVFVWAAYGIYANQGESPAVAGAAITLAGVGLLLVLFELVRRVNRYVLG